MNSPMKALEKLSEEAKLERQRSTASLQENARLKIQLESLKNQLQDVLTNNENYVSQIEQMEHDYLSLEERNKSIEEEKEVHIQKKKEMQMVIDNYEIVVKEFEQQKNEYLNTIASLNTTIEEWNEKYISIEMRLRQKDDLIQQKHEEIVRIKTQSEISEEKNNLLNSKLNEQLKIIENLKNKNSLMNSYEETIQDLQTTNFELRSELENTLKTNTDIRNEIQEYKQKQMEIEIHEETLNTTIHDYEIKIEHLESNISNYEEQVVELNKRVEAEHEVAEAARLQASVAAKGREFVDQKSAEMTQAYDNLFEKNHELTTQCTEATVKIQSLQNELLSYKDKCKQMDQLIQQVESNSNMTIELEYLRSQLSDMRKKLIRKDMEEDATSHLEPRALMDREKNSRAVYEGIILDLRTELDSITSTYHDTCQKLETSLKKCARVDQLEEEVAMYRDAAHSTAMESQSVAMSASEAVERSEQSIHEKHLILRDLKAVENELSRVTAQNARINEEYQLEKIKCKKYHVEKLAAERKASELLAGKARAEAVLDELKQGHDTELLELDRCRRNNKEYLLINNDLKRRISEMEKLQKVTEDSEHSYKMKINEILGRENSLMEEVKLYKQGKENLDKELEQCQHLLNNTKHLYQESQIECNKLYQMIEDLQLERERYHKDITLQEDSRAEVQLQSLRQELQQTVTDWKNSETEKATQDKLMNELRNDLTKEKEKNVLLKTQIALVEDRNKVALQELSVYRSLDVYHTTMNSELNQYRSSNLSNNPNASLNGSINNDASHLYMSQRNNNRNQRYSMMHSSASASPLPLHKSELSNSHSNMLHKTSLYDIDSHPVNMDMDSNLNASLQQHRMHQQRIIQNPTHQQISMPIGHDGGSLHSDLKPSVHSIQNQNIAGIDESDMIIDAKGNRIHMNDDKLYQRMSIQELEKYKEEPPNSNQSRLRRGEVVESEMPEADEDSHSVVSAVSMADDDDMDVAKRRMLRAEREKAKERKLLKEMSQSKFMKNNLSSNQDNASVTSNGNSSIHSNSSQILKNANLRMRNHNSVPATNSVTVKTNSHSTVANVTKSEYEKAKLRLLQKKHNR